MFIFSKFYSWKTKFSNNHSFPAIKKLKYFEWKFGGIRWCINQSLSYQQFSLQAPLHYLASQGESGIAFYSRHLFTGWNFVIVKRSNIFLTSVTWKSLKNRSKRDQNNQALINDMRGAYNIYWRSYEQAVIQHPSFRFL